MSSIQRGLDKNSKENDKVITEKSEDKIKNDKDKKLTDKNEDKNNDQDNEDNKDDNNISNINLIDNTELQGEVKSRPLERKKSTLYEPNLSPKFVYKSSLIIIPKEDELKNKEIEELNKKIAELKKIDFEKLKEDLFFYLELDHPKEVKKY
jgi:hypothetical protein